MKKNCEIRCRKKRNEKSLNSRKIVELIVQKKKKKKNDDSIHEKNSWNWLLKKKKNH